MTGAKMAADSDLALETRRKTQSITKSAAGTLCRCLYVQVNPHRRHFWTGRLQPRNSCQMH